MKRSLTLKLTLAFLLVAVAAAGLVASFVRWSNPERLNQLLLEQNRAELKAALMDYYTSNGDWRGVEDYLRSTGNLPLLPPPPEGNNPQPPPQDRREMFGLTGPNGVVILPLLPNFQRGAQVPKNVLRNGDPIEIDGKIAGTILSPPEPVNLSREEQAYLERTNQALWLASGVAVLVALIVGILLARSLTSPVHALTQAAQRMTAGELEQQVKVSSNDEIGQLAQAFNQMSNQLAEKDRLRQQMTADIAHELRTPLTVIAGYAESMKEGVLYPTEDRLALIHHEIEHLQRLVEDLRTLSRADAGELALNRQSISPTELLSQVAATYGHQAEQKQIKLSLNVEKDLSNIFVDETRLMQVLGNLVSNAIRHTPEGGQISLCTRSNESGWAALEVADTGPGIAVEDVPHVFERFYRADESRADSDGGSGLGLAIAKAIVEAHGGNIEVESRPGEGTVFTVYLSVVDH
ncbi:MAG: HAMP domain-containing protein [Anaerolineales bacterium]|nr:HAMP domain-containing protein [Anaerolineales bacterium]